MPADLSIVGFDDSPLAFNLRPALTTIRQDLTAKGRAAGAGLIAAVRAAGTTTPTDSPAEPAGGVRNVLLPTELVIRASTATPATPSSR